MAVDCGKGAIHSVIAGANAYATDPWLVESGIKDLPSAAEIDFTIRMKILGCAGVLIPDIWHIAAHISRGKIEGSTECDCGMREVAAYAVATLNDVVGGKIRAA